MSHGSINSGQVCFSDSTESTSSEDEDQEFVNDEASAYVHLMLSKKFNPQYAPQNDREQREVKDFRHAHDRDKIREALRAVGLVASGIIAVELRIYDDENGKLFRPPDGWWRHPALAPSEALKRLEDASHPEYVPPAPAIPGEGLVGYLFSNSHDHELQRQHVELMGKENMHHLDLMKHSSSTFEDGSESLSEIISWGHLRGPMASKGTRIWFHVRRRPKVGPKGRSSIYERIGASKALHRLCTTGLHWQDVHSLAADPFQPASTSLQLYDEAGFGLVAGVKFRHKLHRGIVVYYSLQTAEKTQLTDSANEEFIRRSASHIAETYERTPA